ncbi:PepSY-associated TM helix domain-containing protein, partial [uncultured Acinetobacter sp.]|uniref:PepSY-associated TM helix domain-containing protein n=1 Tax=uncultured Acinetobacter sp. TaxID=165433 RepID=UPI0025954025
MRIDAKTEGPRQSMSWLHTWASLILGWLLYAIFLTGTLSFFKNEITVWMTPEVHQSVPASSQIQQTQVALNYLQQNHPNAGAWNILLPNTRQNATLVTVREQGEDPRARRGGKQIYIDSATGEVLKPRETRGGSFLYRFHFELYGMPRIWTRWFVGIATLLMLVAIISGVITHKKIFKDFFTFRSGKGQRSWLDAHNATAVFALPFHIMITFSGLLLLLFTIMPWGIERIYDNRGQFLQEQNRALVEEKKSEQANNQNERSEPSGNPERAAKSESPTQGGIQQARGNHVDQQNRIEGRGERKKRDDKPAVAARLTNLAPIV